jgi:hypothetical protein
LNESGSRLRAFAVLIQIARANVAANITVKVAAVVVLRRAEAAIADLTMP